MVLEKKDRPVREKESYSKSPREVCIHAVCYCLRYYSGENNMLDAEMQMETDHSGIIDWLTVESIHERANALGWHQAKNSFCSSLAFHSGLQYKKKSTGLFTRIPAWPKSDKGMTWRNKRGQGERHHFKASFFESGSRSRRCNRASKFQRFSTRRFKK